MPEERGDSMWAACSDWKGQARWAHPNRCHLLLTQCPWAWGVQCSPLGMGRENSLETPGVFPSLYGSLLYWEE